MTVFFFSKTLSLQQTLTPGILSSLISVTEEVTESVAKSFEDKLEEVGKNFAMEVGIPPWGLVAILIGNEVTFNVPDLDQSTIIDSYYRPRLEDYSAK